MRLLLASSSPRRRALLQLLDIPFVEYPPEIDERLFPGESPIHAARRLATEKARAVATRATDGIVLGADLVVVLDGRVLGKPTSLAHARGMLRDLRDRPHQVITAIALLRPGSLPSYQGVQMTDVWMRRYSDREIETYLRRGDAMDKAGGYAIQDRQFRPVARLEGCYLNVVGLPLCEVVRGLRFLGLPPARAQGVDLLPPCAFCYQGAALFGVTDLSRFYRQAT